MNSNGICDDIELKGCLVKKVAGIDKIQSFKNEGDIIILLGETKEDLGGSDYLKVIHGLEKGFIKMDYLRSGISIPQPGPVSGKFR